MNWEFLIGVLSGVAFVGLILRILLTPRRSPIIRRESLPPSLPLSTLSSSTRNAYVPPSANPEVVGLGVDTYPGGWNGVVESSSPSASPSIGIPDDVEVEAVTDAAGGVFIINESTNFTSNKLDSSSKPVHTRKKTTPKTRKPVAKKTTKVKAPRRTRKIR